MKPGILILLFSILFIVSSHGQSFETDSVSKSEISKLNFMTGKWEGKGWMIGPDRKKTEFEQTENIQFKLDSTTVLIEGVGKNNGLIVHNAMAIVSYDKDLGAYTFQSYLQNGRKGEFKGELIDGKFYWYPNENMRYIIELNENDQWYEVGEYKRENDWFQFFEMTLNKVE
ncbi:hypothetical protein OO013_05455 [Mangrovivirga sp. M17]|uniref:DUF1579 domain-containing protein n=1 Tax=Mangrovivirga halotolerans TaxID=2993936 RepID=A0ABT3RNB2_9BACT|nr:hypothetical protein [Mangrovivirga halotolerans]MCX2743300.1 hypothetical protein [Mangrovivirga halotolerans]